MKIKVSKKLKSRGAYLIRLYVLPLLLILLLR